MMSRKANFYQCLQIRHFTIFYGELVQNIVSSKNCTIDSYFFFLILIVLLFYFFNLNLFILVRG